MPGQRIVSTSPGRRRAVCGAGRCGCGDVSGKDRAATRPQPIEPVALTRRELLGIVCAAPVRCCVHRRGERVGTVHLVRVAAEPASPHPLQCCVACRDGLVRRVAVGVVRSDARGGHGGCRSFGRARRAVLFLCQQHARRRRHIALDSRAHSRNVATEFSVERSELSRGRGAGGTGGCRVDARLVRVAVVARAAAVSRVPQL